jgi:transitional endoplasmic reticulum ATPase
MSAAPAPPAVLELAVHGATAMDADRGLARLDPAELARLGLQAGDVVRLQGPQGRQAYARAIPTEARHRGLGLVVLDGLQREQCGAGVGDVVQVQAAAPSPAQELWLRLEGGREGAAAAPEALRARLLHLPFGGGERVRLRLANGRMLAASVTRTEPPGPVVVGPDTQVRLERAASAAKPAVQAAQGLSYAEVGGLGPQLARVREMVELPLKRPDVFAHLGVEAPKGVLFTGPPGSGKTLLARAVAHEADAAFFQINGPEIVSKHYGDSEAALRKVFKEAEAAAPSIIFIDEIDAIAPKREAMTGDRQVERRIVAQLLTLLDGLAERGQVVVMAATNLPDSLDPALRRPGRFDREIAFTPPDRDDRRAILEVHTRRMPLAEDVDLEAVAAGTHGYVGADLAALAREAAMAAIRRAGEDGALAELRVLAADFATAQRAVGPSAIREVFLEAPDVSWADIGGLEAVKSALSEAVIWPLKHPQAFAAMGVEPAKGVLLAGPPGCGKTHIAKALANESRVNFIPVRSAQLLSRYVGETEQAVRSVFAKARQTAPCIVFFDEFDALAPHRAQADGVTQRLIAQLLTEIDGVEEMKGVFLLAATNRAGAIDPALLRPGRFDLVLHLDPPDLGERLEILTICTRAMPLEAGVDLRAVAEAAAGCVGADLKALSQTAARLALKRSLRVGEADSALITPEDFEAALRLRQASDAARLQVDV